MGKKTLDMSGDLKFELFEAVDQFMRDNGREPTTLEVKELKRELVFGVGAPRSVKSDEILEPEFDRDDSFYYKGSNE